MAPTTITEKQMSDARMLLSWGVVQAVLGDKQKNSDRQLPDVLEQCVRENLRQCEEWSQILLKDLLISKTATDQIRRLNEHMKDFLNQSFRQRYVDLSSSSPTSGRPYEAHITVLRRNNSDLSRKLKLEGTSLLDRLYECDILSESDRQSILAKPTDKRKNEAFIEYLCSNFTTETFQSNILPIIAEEQVHENLAKMILDDLENAKTNTETIRCTFCKMKALVNPRKLSEALFEQRSISQSLKQDLCMSTQPNSTKWEELLKSVKKDKQLLDALQKTYKHLFWEFQNTGHSVLKCCCFDLEGDVAKMSDFTEDQITDDRSEASTVIYKRDTLRQRNTSGLTDTVESRSSDRKPDASRTETEVDDGEHEYINIPSLFAEPGSTELKTSSVSSAQGSNTQEDKIGEGISGPESEGTSLPTQSADELMMRRADELMVTSPDELMVTSADRDFQGDQSELTRLLRECDGVKQQLSTETSPATVQDLQGKINRLSRLIHQREQLLDLAEKQKVVISEIKKRIQQFEMDYEQETVLFKKVNASRMLQSAKSELEQKQTEYAEKRQKIESSCVLM